MRHIKEPDGVDFVINSRPLTKEEEQAISEFIKSQKLLRDKRKVYRARTSRQRKVTA